MRSMSAPPEECDIAVVGAGIVGLAVARELAAPATAGERRACSRPTKSIARHQTARNSGVVHAGIYYRPGSLKARLCVEGARELYELCEREGVRHERCGKVIVARDESELGRLDELERRGRENGVPGLRRLDAGGIEELEPHCRGVAGLHSPDTGIVDFPGVARALAAGLDVRTGAGVSGVRADGRRLVADPRPGRDPRPLRRLLRRAPGGAAGAAGGRAAPPAHRRLSRAPT